MPPRRELMIAIESSRLLVRSRTGLDGQRPFPARASGGFRVGKRPSSPKKESERNRPRLERLRTVDDDSESSSPVTLSSKFAQVV